MLQVYKKLGTFIVMFLPRKTCTYINLYNFPQSVFVLISLHSCLIINIVKYIPFTVYD